MKKMEEIYDALKSEFGCPAKWQLLFPDERTKRLIQGKANRLAGSGDSVDNPYIQEGEEIGKPASAYVGDDATTLALNDAEILKVFEDRGLFGDFPRFYTAGEPRRFFFDPSSDDFRAGILVAGGNAAGLNAVVDAIMKRLTGVASKRVGDRKFRPQVIGYEGGYRGLKYGKTFSGSGEDGILTIEDTDPRAGDPCIFLKTLRGESRFDDIESEDANREAEIMADQVVKDRLKVLFVIGGNGSLAWASKIHRTLQARGEQVAVVCGPKTMDMDIAFAEASFGFRSAVDKAVEFIRTVHWEAETQNRIAVIELFGAGSGFVALHAGFLSGDADYIMIPEDEDVEEPQVFDHLQARLESRGHAVLVVAEGALEDFQHGSPEEKAAAFGNFVDRLKAHFKAHPGYQGLVDVRPRYLIRGTPANSADLDLAKYTGYLMADTALRGFTDCSVQYWQGEYVIVPLSTATGRLGRVERWSPYFWYMAQRYRLPSA